MLSALYVLFNTYYNLTKYAQIIPPFYRLKKKTDTERLRNLSKVTSYQEALIGTEPTLDACVSMVNHRLHSRYRTPWPFLLWVISPQPFPLWRKLHHF